MGAEKDLLKIYSLKCIKIFNFRAETSSIMTSLQEYKQSESSTGSLTNGVDLFIKEALYSYCSNHLFQG